ncbi:MAG: histone deacetylase [Candidatus Lambdaproteobacteria bacterium]|nr:histone deacetylase [Candidatus Lambdaproteobacteria bacterium]
MSDAHPSPATAFPADDIAHTGADRAASLAGRPVYWAYDRYSASLPTQHRYPRGKVRLVRELLLAEGTVQPAQLREGTPADWALLGRVHTADYLHAVRTLALSPQAERELGLPFSEGLALRARASVQSTVEGARHALERGVAATFGGGNHHAFPERPSGYCLLNDIAVAIRELQAAGLAERLAIIDLDVHQGNANAEIFRQERRVFTLSAHGARNWPYRKARSDVDIPLPDGTGDAAYLDAVRGPIEALFRDFRPDIVFYQAGVDGLSCDRLGRLALTHDGLRRRDAFVIGLCLARHCPLVVTMGGGYGNPIEDTVEAHANTFRELERQWPG